ncbi:MAG: DUF1549 and DUF1553 domain-containing protein [Planctomycetota bacterium]|nr:DUF1549 and DUF1553 domain-containing protein [Planctomycetota bacterium]
MQIQFRHCSIWMLVCLCGLSADELLAQVQVHPQHVSLKGRDSRWQLLVSQDNAGLSEDLTRSATYRSVNAEVASVSPDGVVRGISNGETAIEISTGGLTHRLPVTVLGSAAPRRVHFETDVLPILSRFGCNSSGCHGKAEGQNGFKLSIFGFDPGTDRAALTQEGRGRRTNRTIPDQSLLLLKASGGMPHGGGIRIRKNSGEYQVLRDWITTGGLAGDPDAPKLVAIQVTPHDTRMAMDSSRQLQVTARFSNGREIDVTHLAKFQTNSESLATVDEFGLVTTSDNPGEAAIMASYLGEVDVFRAIVPQPDDGTTFPQQPVLNFIDGLVDAKLRKLNIHPAGLCSDADFLRRVYLDIIGTLPTAAEARTFLADSLPDKRSTLVDSLLVRKEYADFQALKWSDVLRVERLTLGHKHAYTYYRWIREAFVRNRPFDDVARDIIAATGPLSRNPAANLFRVAKKPGEVAATVSQVFMGIRIECAQCHHHPFDQWSQRDYYGMEAFFTQVNFKSTPADQVLIPNKKDATKHPRTGDAVQAHALLQDEPTETPDGDRRRLFADWLTASDNKWFARNIVNRVWAQFLGRGIVDPVDDFRLTNPPTNPELLDALAKQFVESGFDMHALIRTITSSRTYQLTTTPSRMNERDEQNASRALFRRLDAEVRFDMICQVTGASEKFEGVPAGYRAIELWDSQVPHYFLSLFGRPVRATACECERANQPSVAQVLHVLNSPQIQEKLSSDAGKLAMLEGSIPDDGKLVEEIYLAFYSRFPTPDEQESVSRYLATADNRRKAVEDVAWSLMNTVEFLFNH